LRKRFKDVVEYKSEKSEKNLFFEIIDLRFLRKYENERSI